MAFELYKKQKLVHLKGVLQRQCFVALIRAMCDDACVLEEFIWEESNTNVKTKYWIEKLLAGIAKCKSLKKIRLQLDVPAMLFDKVIQAINNNKSIESVDLKKYNRYVVIIN